MRDIPFYYNRVSGKCTWEQPQDWVFADRKKIVGARKCGSALVDGGGEPDGHPICRRCGGAQTRRALRATMDGAKIMKKCEFNYLAGSPNLASR